MFAQRRPGLAARAVVTTVVLAASNLAAHVGAFAPASHVATPRPLQLATGTCRLRPGARQPARFAMTAHYVPQTVDGALLEGLKQSAWEGKAPAIDRFNMQVNGPPSCWFPLLLSASVPSSDALRLHVHTQLRGCAKRVFAVCPCEGMCAQRAPQHRVTRWATLIRTTCGTCVAGGTSVAANLSSSQLPFARGVRRDYQGSC